MSLKIPAEWTFKKKEVADNFDSHVREQLPWYELTTGVVSHVARHYVPEGGTVYDIGASTGNIGRAVAEVLKSRQVKFIPIDNSSDMGKCYQGPGKLIIADAVEFDFKRFDLAICFLTLMFLTKERRALLLTKLRKQLKPGGAIIIFDKCTPAGGYVATVLWRLTLAGKVAGGASPDDIIAKELSLAGVQRPIEPEELGEAVEIFRFGDFAGWIIEGV